MSTRVRIDGKIRNINSRKFCLTCSPFGKHNTSKTAWNFRGPTVKGTNKPYAEWSEKSKDTLRQGIKRRGLDRKLECIKLKGGACRRCGYNKCSNALHFHHLTPENKMFNLDVRTIASKTWDTILLELSKCDLVCANCHAELHMEEHKIKQTSNKSNSDIEVLPVVLETTTPAL